MFTYLMTRGQNQGQNRGADTTRTRNGHRTSKSLRKLTDEGTYRTGTNVRTSMQSLRPSYQYSYHSLTTAYRTYIYKTACTRTYVVSIRARIQARTRKQTGTKQYEYRSATLRALVVARKIIVRKSTHTLTSLLEALPDRIAARSNRKYTRNLTRTMVNMLLGKTSNGNQ
eukprot:scaffold574333_cov17-Prasinocladus_malaysianus.AAC.1